MKIEHMKDEELGEGAWLTIEEGRAYYMPGCMIIFDDNDSAMKITWDEEIDEEKMAEHMEKVMEDLTNNLISNCFKKAL